MCSPTMHYTKSGILTHVIIHDGLLMNSQNRATAENGTMTISHFISTWNLTPKSLNKISLCRHSQASISDSLECSLDRDLQHGPYIQQGICQIVNGLSKGSWYFINPKLNRFYFLYFPQATASLLSPLVTGIISRYTFFFFFLYGELTHFSSSESKK